MEVWQELRGELADVVRKRVASANPFQSLKGMPVESREELREDLERLGRLVLDHRDPHVAIVGKREPTLREILEPFGHEEMLDVRERLGHGRWYDHVTEHGVLRLADLRSDEESPLLPLDYEEPDVILAVARSEDEDVARTVDTLIEAMDRVEDRWDVFPPAIVAVYRGDEGRGAGDFKTQQAFKDEFASRGLGRDFVEVVSTARRGKLERVMLSHVGDEARFALARVLDDRSAKSEMALDLIRIASSLNATIATVPIPVGSFLPITTIQVCMIAGIAYISGREVNAKTLAEFATAMGLNVGAGVALREIARAFIQWIPVAGSVISASIAAGATFTLGKAAIRYYIDD